MSHLKTFILFLVCLHSYSGFSQWNMTINLGSGLSYQHLALNCKPIYTANDVQQSSYNPDSWIQIQIGRAFGKHFETRIDIGYLAGGNITLESKSDQEYQKLSQRMRAPLAGLTLDYCFRTKSKKLRPVLGIGTQVAPFSNVYRDQSIERKTETFEISNYFKLSPRLIFNSTFGFRYRLTKQTALQLDAVFRYPISEEERIEQGKYLKYQMNGEDVPASQMECTSCDYRFFGSDFVETKKLNTYSSQSSVGFQLGYHLNF